MITETWSSQISALFNLVHSGNSFTELRIEDVKFKGIHMTQDGTYQMHGLIDNISGGGKTKKLIIKNVEILDSTYEAGNGWMYLTATTTLIDQITLKNIGRLQMFEDKQKWGFLRTF